MRLAEYINALRDLETNKLDFNEDHFWLQFCRNNWQNATVVPEVTLSVHQYTGEYHLTQSVTNVVLNNPERLIKMFPLCVVYTNPNGSKQLYQRVRFETSRGSRGQYGVGVYEPIKPLGLSYYWQEYDINSDVETSMFSAKKQNEVRYTGVLEDFSLGW